MDNQKQSIIDRIKQSNNILVTVSANPSVDQLAACVGLTIMLNELDKRATAVFSGVVPSTLEFLQPEETIEKNTDSLRDFIIALDKSKADKLRYKVEDAVVKIFITPYRTSISDKDLEFSQGDFNVDVVVCIGVQDQKDLDQAILAHGRILHDATVVSINTQGQSTLGTLNWVDPQASSLSEMVASMTEGFGAKLDPQIATAFLTGVVAETERFSNSKTSPQTMQLSAQLMAAGANQQLVATKLQAASSLPPPPKAGPTSGNDQDNYEPPAAATTDDGTLSIAHAKNEVPVRKKPPAEEAEQEPAAEEEKHEAPEKASPEQGQKNEAGAEDHVSLPPVQPTKEKMPPPPSEASEKAEELPSPIHINTEPEAHVENEDRDILQGKGPATESDVTSPAEDEQPSGVPNSTPSFVLTPPTLGGVLTANSRPEGLDPSTDPFSQTPGTVPPILTHNGSGSAENKAGSSENGARNAVSEAINSRPTTGLPARRADFSAQQMGGELHDNARPTEPMNTLVEPLRNEPAPAADSPSAQPMDMPLPAAPTGPIAPPIEPLTPSANASPAAPTSPPPPVPPPFMPQSIMPNGQ